MKILKSKEERELLRKQRLEDKELMKEIDKETKEEERMEYEKFIDDMLLTDEKQEKEEMESLMSPEDIKDMQERDKEDMRILIIAGSIISVVIIVAVIVLFTVDYATQSELMKDTLPIYEKYYEEKYDKKLKYLDFNYLCKMNEDYKEECSDIVHMITMDNEHIMSIKNDMIGDDVSTSKIVNEYNDNMRTFLASLDLISNYPILSYKDYYLDYNIHLDYIHTLPSNVDYQTMRNTKKLTVTEFIFYKGEYDANLVNSFINNFSDDSEFYFVKNIRGLPSEVTIVKKGKTEHLNITASIPFTGGIYYELDRDKNSVSSVNVSKVNGNDITHEGDYKYINCYNIELEQNVPWDKKDTMSHYYFIKLDDINFNEKNIYEFSSSSYENGYSVISDDEYKTVITYNNGSGTYIIGDESVGIGNVSTEDSFLCKIGLC